MSRQFEVEGAVTVLGTQQMAAQGVAKIAPMTLNHRLQSAVERLAGARARIDGFLRRSVGDGDQAEGGTQLIGGANKAIDAPRRLQRNVETLEEQADLFHKLCAELERIA